MILVDEPIARGSSVCTFIPSRVDQNEWKQSRINASETFLSKPYLHWPRVVRGAAVPFLSPPCLEVARSAAQRAKKARTVQMRFELEARC